MIVLDTHAWIWWTNGRDDLMSAAASEAIGAASQVAISAWSCWEIATLARRERIVLDRPVARWLAEARAMTEVRVIPVTESIAAAAGALPSEFPGDPSDRAIYSTAIASAGHLVTRDAAIRAFDPLRTIW